MGQCQRLQVCATSRASRHLIKPPLTHSQGVWNRFKYSSSSGQAGGCVASVGWDEELRARTAEVGLPRPGLSESSFRTGPSITNEPSSVEYVCAMSCTVAFDPWANPIQDLGSYDGPEINYSPL